MTLTQEHYLMDAKGRKKAVVLSIKEYEQLLEDLHDLAIVAERRKEKSIGHGEMKRRLKKVGLI